MDEHFVGYKTKVLKVFICNMILSLSYFLCNNLSDCQWIHSSWKYIETLSFISSAFKLMKAADAKFCKVFGRPVFNHLPSARKRDSLNRSTYIVPWELVKCERPFSMYVFHLPSFLCKRMCSKSFFSKLRI